jgi:hypothetical protein
VKKRFYSCTVNFPIWALRTISRRQDASEEEQCIVCRPVSGIESLLLPQQALGQAVCSIPSACSALLLLQSSALEESSAIEGPEFCCSEFPIARSSGNKRTFGFWLLMAADFR